MAISTDDLDTFRLKPDDCQRKTEPEPLAELRGFLQPGPVGTLGRLGRYDVLEFLGQGGFGIVVKAFDASLQRLVAIKLLAPQLALTSAPRKYFLREARAAAKVSHDNVVQIHSVEEQPLPYLVMEYIEGETLQERLDRTGPLETEEAARLGREIALGLAAAHATGVIHRDIKPANILLERGVAARVKLTDFGIARTADDASLTQSGVIVGTPMYMAPEQANGEAVDHRADLFSLGSVLYAMVSGRPPFRASSTMAVLKRVMEDTPRPLQQVNPTAHGGLCAVIARLHAKTPKDRPASALAVAQELEHCLTKDAAVSAGPRRRWAGVVAACLILLGALGLNAANFMEAPGQAPPLAALPLPGPNSPPDVAAEELPAPVAAAELWANAVAAMPVGDQVPAVNAQLRVLNPKYDDAGLTYSIKDGAVDALILTSGELTDVSPLRALRRLRELQIHSHEVNGLLLHSPFRDLQCLQGLQLQQLNIHNASVDDLTPLRGMPLKHLAVWGFMGQDLSPLQGMELNVLNCGLSKVSDLSPLRGMPLTFLCVNHSEVADLSPLRGMKLTQLLIDHTKVTDLTPILDAPIYELSILGLQVTNLEGIRRLPLKHLMLDFDASRHLSLLRSIPSLERINHRPAAEFLTAAGG